MKKLALPLIGILFPLSVFSQFSLESSSTLPRANDTIVKQCVEYRDPGRSGANVLWDFSELELLDDAYTISYGQIGDSLTGIEQEHLSDVCPCCGKPAKTMVYWGIAY